MVKSKQTYLKREKEEKRKNKRKEKEEKREERKSNSNKGKGFDAMIAYVDEKGNFSDTPPDPILKKELKLEDIQLGAHVSSGEKEHDFITTGRVTYYNESKGYGFIKDSATKESVFFHLTSTSEPLKLNDLVSFQKMKGPKGMTATSVLKVG